MQSRKFYVVFLIFIILTHSLLSSTFVEKEIIKVGYVIHEGFQEGYANEQKTGFGYEYLQKISYYTGWSYEYCYGSFVDLFEKLKKGEIHLMGNISYTEERGKSILFSSAEQGTESFYLFISSKNNLTHINEYSDLNGKIIGISKASFQIEVFKKFCEENNIKCTIKEYEDNEKRAEDLNNGVIFGTVESSIVAKSEHSESWVPIINIATSSFYFGITKSRPDILKKIDDVQERIKATNRFYNEEVKVKYLKGQEVVSQLLDSSLETWIKNNPVINIGYLDGYLPFCFEDKETGNLEGVVRNLIDYFSEKYPISFKTKKYSSYQTMISDLKNNNIDVVVPVISNFWVAEKEDIALTDSFVSSSMLLFKKNSDFSKEGVTSIAVTKSNPFSENYAKVYFPNAKLVYFPTTKECLEAVKKHDFLSTIYNLNCYYVDKNISNIFNSLYITPLNDSIEVCFAIKKGNIELLSFLNKCLAITSSSIVNSSIVENSFVDEVISLENFIRNHPKIMFYSTFIIIIVLSSIFLSYIIIANRNRKKLNILREQAEFANAAKTTFLFNMTHDIRTPMNAIVGFTAMAQQNIRDTKKIKDYLNKIKISGDTLLDLINKVLDLARIESNNIQVNLNVENITKFGKVLKSMFENDAKEKGISLIFNTDIQDEYYYLDQSMMNQICVNLMGNALKFTPSGGTITHTIKQLSKPNIYGYVNIEFSIKDNGIGMSEEYLSKAFDAFSRERTSTESGIQGTGLGLSIVKRTCDILGAKLNVKSGVGKGTEFTIGYKLKVGAKPISEDKKKKKSVFQPSFKGKKVLLVEDNVLNQQVAGAILKGFGLTVDYTDNGQSAVMLALDNDYKLIFMDIQMPIMDGYDATHEIRNFENKTKANVPIIAMTANAFAEDKKKALDAGMTDFVSKPINIDELLQKTKEYIC